VGARPAAAKLADVAVVAKHLEILRKSLCDDPGVKMLRPTHCRLPLSVLSTVVVDVVEREHAWLRFTTTTAPISAVCGKHLIAKFLLPRPSPSSDTISVLCVVAPSCFAIDFRKLLPPRSFLERCLGTMAFQARVLPVLLAAAVLGINKSEFPYRFCTLANPAKSAEFIMANLDLTARPCRLIFPAAVIACMASRASRR